MNANIFGSKRVFLSAVRFARVQLKPLADGLTAARFDMMYALTSLVGPDPLDFGHVGEVPEATRELGDDYVFERTTLYQSDLRRLLGVSAPVVSRMLRSLEALGWVTRKRPMFGDQRQRQVTLTNVGLRLFRAAYKALSGMVDAVVYRAICWRKHDDSGERFEHMSRLEEYLNSLRLHFGDTAGLYNPWGHPDD
jgi:DNA-binding MarR family transcriptional regulator